MFKSLFIDNLLEKQLLWCSVLCGFENLSVLLIFYEHLTSCLIKLHEEQNQRDTQKRLYWVMNDWKGLMLSCEHLEIECRTKSTFQTGNVWRWKSSLWYGLYSHLIKWVWILNTLNCLLFCYLRCEKFLCL